MKIPPMPSVLLDALGSVMTQLRAALRIPLRDPDTQAVATASDFDQWLHRDPSLIRTPAHHYGDRSPGCVTGNGLGSLEIGGGTD